MRMTLEPNCSITVNNRVTYLIYALKYITAIMFNVITILLNIRQNTYFTHTRIKALKNHKSYDWHYNTANKKA